MYSDRDLTRLAQRFLDIPEMKLPDRRNGIVWLVERALGVQLERREVEKGEWNDALSTIAECAGVARGMAKLCEVLEAFVGRGVPEVTAFVSLCRELHPCPMLTRDQADQLEDLLAGAPAPDNLPDLVRFAVGGDDLSPEYRFEDLTVVVRDMQELVSAEPLIRFVEAFASEVETKDRGSAKRLRSWDEETARSLGVDQQWLDNVRARVSIARPPDREHVLFWIIPDRGDPSIHYLEAWRYAQGRFRILVDEVASARSLSEFRPRVGNAIRGFLAGARGPVVEFLLPRRWLNEKVDQWKVDSDGDGSCVLGLRHPVVVRAPDPDMQPANADEVRRRARGLRDCVVYDQKKIKWHDGDHWHDGERDASGGDWVCLALTCPSSNQIQTLTDTVLASDAAVAVWHRNTRSGAERREALASLLNARPLARLPDTVLSQRRGASDDDSPPSHAGHEVVLYWEDPDRLPPEWPELSEP